VAEVQLIRLQKAPLPDWITIYMTKWTDGKTSNFRSDWGSCSGCETSMLFPRTSLSPFSYEENQVRTVIPVIGLGFNKIHCSSNITVVIILYQAPDWDLCSSFPWNGNDEDRQKQRINLNDTCTHVKELPFRFLGWRRSRGIYLTLSPAFSLKPHGGRPAVNLCKDASALQYGRTQHEKEKHTATTQPEAYIS
jgi:hypothetical protein